MTDAEIIKGLECCNRADNAVCYDCPYNEYNRVDAHYPYSCQRYLRMDALTLINRQKEEIEEQKQDIADLNETIANLLAQFRTLGKDINVHTIRAEAIRDIVHRLRCEAYFDGEARAVALSDIHKIARGMIEEQK